MWEINLYASWGFSCPSIFEMSIILITIWDITPNMSGMLGFRVRVPNVCEAYRYVPGSRVVRYIVSSTARAYTVRHCAFPWDSRAGDSQGSSSETRCRCSRFCSRPWRRVGLWGVWGFSCPSIFEMSIILITIWDNVNVIFKRRKNSNYRLHVHRLKLRVLDSPYFLGFPIASCEMLWLF